MITSISYTNNSISDKIQSVCVSTSLSLKDYNYNNRLSLREENKESNLCVVDHYDQLHCPGLSCAFFGLSSAFLKKTEGGRHQQLQVQFVGTHIVAAHMYGLTSCTL